MPFKKCTYSSALRNRVTMNHISSAVQPYRAYPFLLFVESEPLATFLVGVPFKIPVYCDRISHAILEPVSSHPAFPSGFICLSGAEKPKAIRLLFDVRIMGVYRILHFLPTAEYTRTSYSWDSYERLDNVMLQQSVIMLIHYLCFFSLPIIYDCYFLRRLFININGSFTFIKLIG